MFMKKAIAVIFGFSITAGVSYLVWVYSGLGKSVLSKWLLNRWKEMAEKGRRVIDVKNLEAELKKLEYEDIELLFRYTRSYPTLKVPGGAWDKKKIQTVEKIREKLFARNFASRADLTSLNNINLFGR